MERVLSHTIDSCLFNNSVHSLYPFLFNSLLFVDEMEVLNNRSLFNGFEYGVMEQIRSLPTDSYYLLSSGRFVELD